MLKPTALLLAVVLAGTASAQAPHTHRHSFENAAQWAKSFDDPRRDAWQKPHEVIAALKLAPDAKVADIGAGTGYFAVRLAHMLPQGRVYAVDSERGMVEHLAKRAKEAGIINLSAVQAEPGSARLPEAVDLALLVDVYHHIESREDYFRRLAESLKPGGRVAVVDFNAVSKIGPPPKERLAPAQVETEMKAAGFRRVAAHDFLPNQFFLVFERDGGTKP
jgi:predicted methyltransferase